MKFIFIKSKDFVFLLYWKYIHYSIKRIMLTNYKMPSIIFLHEGFSGGCNFDFKSEKGFDLCMN